MPHTEPGPGPAMLHTATSVYLVSHTGRRHYFGTFAPQQADDVTRAARRLEEVARVEHVERYSLARGAV